jgi:hypothetical protein
MKGFGTIAAIEATLLALAVGFFLHSERHTSFPQSVQAPAPSLRTITAVPVSFDVATAGVTTTAASTRGGAAVATSANAGSGHAGFRTMRTSHPVGREAIGATNAESGVTSGRPGSAPRTR